VYRLCRGYDIKPLSSAWDTMMIVIPVEDFPPETLQLIGALALYHSCADDSLTFFLTVFHSRHFTLGYPLFAELFFGAKSIF
jgi:hypothetical protein